MEPETPESEERIASLEAQVRMLRDQLDEHQRLIDDVPVDRPRPVHRVVGDQYIKVQQDRRDVILQFNEDTLKQRIPGTAGGGGGGIIGSCPDMWVTYKMRCAPMPSGQPPLWIEFQRNLITCAIRVRAFDDCCSVCEDGSSGAMMTDLDRWEDCDGNGNYVYLDSEIRLGVGAAAVIQLDGSGLCYELDATGVTANPTTWETITVVGDCSDSDCASPAPCECPGQGSFTSLKVTNLNGGSLVSAGSMAGDQGAGCANCGGPFSLQTAWDGTGINSYNEANCRFSHPGPMYINITPGDDSSQLALSEFSVFLDTVNCRWVIKAQWACPASVDLYWFKEFGDDWTGTYTLQTVYGAGAYENSPSLEGCITPLATLTIANDV